MSADFGGFIDSFIPEARQMAESRMKTTVALQFKVGTTHDPETDADVPVYETFVQTKARIKSPDAVLRMAQAGGRTAASASTMLSVPIDTADPWSDPRSAQGVTALILAVHHTGNHALLGRRLVLEGPTDGDQTSARRLQVSEVVT